MMRILLFRVLRSGPLFSETPIFCRYTPACVAGQVTWVASRSDGGCRDVLQKQLRSNAEKITDRTVLLSF